MNALAAGPAPRPRPKVEYPDAYPNWHYPAEFVLKPSPFDSAVESAHVVRRHHQSLSQALHTRSSTPTPAPTAAASTLPCHSRSASTSTAHAARASGSRADPGPAGVADPAATGAVRTASDPDTVAYYLSAPSSSQGTARRLLGAFRPRAPVYLTSFVYEDAEYVESGSTRTAAAPSTSTPSPSPSASASAPVAAPGVPAPAASATAATTTAATTTTFRSSPNVILRQQRCTRAELCAAFARLVREWHHFWSFGMDVLFHVPTSPPAGREAEFEERFGDTIARLRATWKSTQYRLFWGTYLFGDYLEALSEMEDAGRLPARWPRTMLDTTARAVRFPGCSLTHRAPGGRLDDYVFRAARVVNRKEAERIPEVEDAYTDIESLMWDMLDFKGLDPELSLEALPKMRGAAYSTPGRFEPPPPPYAPPSYEDACGSCSGCSSAESSSRASSGWGSPRSSYDSASSE